VFLIEVVAVIMPCESLLRWRRNKRAPIYKMASEKTASVDTLVFLLSVQFILFL
jgi:hypothetical protein